MRIENLIFRSVGIYQRENRSDLHTGMAADTKTLFEKATSSIQIVSGGFSNKIYCEKEVVGAIESAVKRECFVEVIVGPKANKDCLKVWTSFGIPVYQLSEWPNRHFAIVDDKHVRVEEPHEQGHEKQVQYIVYNFKNADKLKRVFDEYKKQATLLKAS